MKIRFLLTFLSLFLVIRSNAQYYPGTTSGGGAPGTTKRSPLNTLERSPNVAGRTILTDAVGNQRWADFVEIEPTPIPFVPTSTGNVAFLSSFVTATTGDIYYIDWFGRAILIRAAASAVTDRDWLKISNNGIPQAITDSVYTDNYAAVNMRRVWPNAQFLVGDSTALTGANAVVVGNRDARVGFYRLTDNAWSSIGQEGGSLTARLGTGTSSLLVQTAAGASSSQPAGPFRNIFEVRKDSLIRLLDYPTIRRDTQSGNNYLYTDVSGYLRSKEFTGGGGVSLPLSQIGYGSGPGIVSSNRLTYTTDSVLNIIGKISITDRWNATNIGLAGGRYSKNDSGFNGGYFAGEYDTSNYTVNIGPLAGRYNKGNFGFFGGLLAGQKNIGLDALGIGTYALQDNEGFGCISIGNNSSTKKKRGNRTTTIGVEAQGGALEAENGCYFGWRAGYWQAGTGNSYFGESFNDQGFFGNNNGGVGLQGQHDNYSSSDNNSMGALALYTLQTVFPGKGQLITGVTYLIGFKGTTNWLSIGATSDTSFHSFVYNGALATGNGTARNITAGSNKNLALGNFAGYYVGRGNRGIYVGDNCGSSEYFAGLSDILLIENSNSDTSLVSGNFANNRVGINKKVKDLNFNLHTNGTVGFENLPQRSGSGFTKQLFQNPTTGEISYGDTVNQTYSNDQLVFGLNNRLGQSPSLKWDNALGNLNVGGLPTAVDEISVNGEVSSNAFFNYRNNTSGVLLGQFGGGQGFNDGSINDLGFRLAGTGNVLFGNNSQVNSCMKILGSGNVVMGNSTVSTTPNKLTVQGGLNTFISVNSDQSGGSDLSPNYSGVISRGTGNFEFARFGGVDRSNNKLEGAFSVIIPSDVLNPVTRLERLNIDGLLGNVRMSGYAGTGNRICSFDVDGNLVRSNIDPASVRSLYTGNGTIPANTIATVTNGVTFSRVHSTINQRSVLSARVTTNPADEIALLFKAATPVDSFEIRQTNGVYNFAVNNTDRMSFVPQENAVQMNAAFRKKLTPYTSEPSNLTNDVGTAVVTGTTTVNFNLPDIVGTVVNANQVRVGTEYTIIVDKTTATNINAAAGDTIKQGGTIPGTSTIIVPALNVYTRTYIAGASNTWYVTN